MRNYFYDLQIDKKPILVPDCDVAVECTDLDDEDSGRDESGVMHRIVLRENVRTIQLNYAFLRAEEYLYMESLFKGKPEFKVEYRSFDGSLGEFTAYRAKHGITIHSAKTGLCKNYKFSLIEC